MLKEKKRLIIYKVIAIILFVSTLLTIYFTLYAPPKQAKIIDEDASKTYYESSDRTSATIDIVLNRTLGLDEEISIRIEFYDISDNYLEAYTKSSNGGEKTYSFSFFVDGDAEYYVITDLEVARDLPSLSVTMCIILSILILAIFLGIIAIGCNYKIYTKDDKKIIVYCGVYHRYIKVNGKITAKYSALSNFVPITISCTLEDGTRLEATFSTSNWISLKINDVLCNPDRSVKK